MKYLKRISSIISVAVVLFILGVVINGLSIPTSAVTCTAGNHNFSKYCDASHPHQNYQVCNWCGMKQYLSTYTTKKHGDGSWGSGTCPSCGTHTYVGRSCTSQGTCACGATIAPYAHSYTQYCDASHPHRDYKVCTGCGYKYYLNTYSTKNHGNGAYGSGTCPSCGTHTFVGRTCVSEGTCSCGATISPGGHSYTQYCDATHPHQDYKVCTLCGDKYYLNTYSTKNHGSGRWGSGTCPQCGEHKYDSIDFDMLDIHPHYIVMKCSCGHQKTDGNMYYENCSECTQGSKTVTTVSDTPVWFQYLDGDEYLPAVITFPTTLHMEYQESYKIDGKFISFHARNYCELDKKQIPAWAPKITLTANTEVKYYNSKDKHIFSIFLSNSPYVSANDRPGSTFVKDFLPSYSVTGATAYVEGALSVVQANMKTIYQH